MGGREGRRHRGDKGGKSGQWSARKAQLATHEYKKAGGGYEGGKTDDNRLTRWTREDWGTKSGGESGKTGERYLPRKARAHLSASEYRRTTAKKRADTAKGKQVSPQPKDIAAKTATDRAGSTEPTRAELMQSARAAGIVGRSSMRKVELARALRERG